MPVNSAFEGRVFPPCPPYTVGREAVREFAAAVGATHAVHHDVAAARAAGHADVVAPSTFAVVVAQRAESDLVREPSAGIDFSRVVHTEEKITVHRPIVAGLDLVATLHVDRMREVGGHGMVGTRCEIADADGVAVATVVSGLLVRGDA